MRSEQLQHARLRYGSPLALIIALAGASAAQGSGNPIEPSMETGDSSVSLSVGQPMADFGLRALDPQTGQLGAMVWLSDYVGADPRRKAPRRLLLLNFFATWCQPCLRELPVLSQLQRAYGARGLQIVSVNVRKAGEPLATALAGTLQLWRADPPAYPFLFDRYTNRNQHLYMGRHATLPCNLLIDERGVIVERYQGAGDEALATLQASVRQRLEAAPTPASAAAAE